jgi:hypothetical protein
MALGSEPVLLGSVSYAPKHLNNTQHTRHALKQFEGPFAAFAGRLPQQFLELLILHRRDLDPATIQCSREGAAEHERYGPLGRRILPAPPLRHPGMGNLHLKGFIQHLERRGEVVPVAFPLGRNPGLDKSSHLLASVSIRAVYQGEHRATLASHD